MFNIFEWLGQIGINKARRKEREKDEQNRLRLTRIKEERYDIIYHDIREALENAHKKYKNDGRRVILNCDLLNIENDNDGITEKGLKEVIIDYKYIMDVFSKDMIIYYINDFISANNIFITEKDSWFSHLEISQQGGIITLAERVYYALSPEARFLIPDIYNFVKYHELCTYELQDKSVIPEMLAKNRNLLSKEKNVNIFKELLSVLEKLNYRRGTIAYQNIRRYYLNTYDDRDINSEIEKSFKTIHPLMLESETDDKKFGIGYQVFAKYLKRIYSRFDKDIIAAIFSHVNNDFIINRHFDNIYLDEALLENIKEYYHNISAKNKPDPLYIAAMATDYIREAVYNYNYESLEDKFQGTKEFNDVLDYRYQKTKLNPNFYFILLLVIVRKAFEYDKSDKENI